MPDMDKRALIAELRADIARSVAVLARAAADAREAATHEEAKPENDKDTRSVEAAYLAGAQAARARELTHAAAELASLDLRDFSPGAPIASSALIELEHDGVTHLYFLAPHGGGLRTALNGVAVKVITPQSALGRELLGKSDGDDVEVTLEGRLRTYAIVRVV